MNTEAPCTESTARPTHHYMHQLGSLSGENSAPGALSKGGQCGCTEWGLCCESPGSHRQPRGFNRPLNLSEPVPAGIIWACRLQEIVPVLSETPQMWWGS